VPLAALDLADMQSIEPGIDERVFSVLSARASMESRTSFGGTAPVRIREQLAAWKARLGE
jgi:argininosuccinate lyase